MIKKYFWAFPDDDPKKLSKSCQKMVPARSGVKKWHKDAKTIVKKMVLGPWPGPWPGPGGFARVPFVVAMNAVASVLAVSVSVVCDQVDQVVPAHQVDDINEVHELDPVHQVDHKDEYGFLYIIFYRFST